MSTLETVPTPETMSEPMDTTDDAATDGEWIRSPVDDDTYNLLMALTSKLEAIDVYQVYAEDGRPDLWRALAEDERRHAERLFNELKQRLAAALQSDGTLASLAVICSRGDNGVEPGVAPWTHPASPSSSRS